MSLQAAVRVTALQKTVAAMRRDPTLIGLAALLATMRVFYDDVGTACTDTLTKVRVDPLFFAGLTLSERLFVLAHEVLHKWQNFFPRFEAWAKKYPGVDRMKLMQIANEAADYLINHWLHHAFKLDMPKGVLYNAEYDNSKMTWEQLADRFMAGEKPENQNADPNADQGDGQPGEGDGSGSGKPGDPGDPDDLASVDNEGEGEGKPEQGQGGMDKGNDIEMPDMYNGDPSTVPSEENLKEHEAATRKDLANAARAAKAAGDTSGFGKMMADEAKTDKVNWKQELYRWAAKVRNTGALSFARPNRRYRVPGGRISLPSRRSKTLGNVAIVIDTSGSTMGEIVSQIMAEVKAVLRGVDFDTLYVMHVDRKVQHVDAFKKGELHKWKPKLYGGGGTKFAPAFKYIYRELPKMAAIVYHTDGYSTFRDLRECKDLHNKLNRPPVLWAINGRTPQSFSSYTEFGTILDCR